jgi:hypothetical protein
MSPWAFEQYARMLGIPPKFLSTCPPTGKGSILDIVQSRMEERAGMDHFIRLRENDADGLSGIVRAVLPGDFTPYDNRHLLEAVRRVVSDGGGEYTIDSHNAADPRRIEDGLELRVLRSNTFDVGEGDAHQIGFHTAVSETGRDNLFLSTMVYRLVCKNGMMGWRDSECLKLKPRNMTVHEITPMVIEAAMASFRQQDAVSDLLKTTMGEVVSNPEATIRDVARRMRLNDITLDRVIELYDKVEGPKSGEKPTRFHVMQAFTRAAKELSASARVEMETKVGNVMFGGGGGVKRGRVDDGMEGVGNG